MYYDPVVEEMERIKEELAEKFNYDLNAMLKDIQEKEKQHKDRLVSFERKRVAEEPAEY